MKAQMMDVKTLIIAIAVLLVISLIILSMSGKLPILQSMFGGIMG